MERFLQSTYTSTRFAERSGKLYNSQKLETLCELARQLNKVITNHKNYFTKCTNEPKYVDVDVFLDRHEKIMEGLGQKQHLMNVELLDSTFYRPKWIFYYSDISSAPLFKMAAGLGESIIINHPFLDGNKRAAHLAISMFLSLNNYQLVADEDSAMKIIQGVATGDIRADKLEHLIARNVEKIDE
ncbi:hypothetical protein C1645_806170 [Glomus cerebriforme]|uniref:Fido domain-containing protein n=1 Tax=Glomus cerebriforme TaxID=658196 RepID=A0A397SU10_9GLOM|nr:hypothetical protein C1645_806170 [Glomus cerebriforme]